MHGQRSYGRLDRTAGVSWRYLVILAAIYITFLVVARVEVVVVPLILALFLASVLSPPVQWFKRKGLSPLLSVWAVFAIVIPLLVLVGFLVVPSVATGIGEIGNDVSAGIEQVREWLRDGPLRLSDTEIDRYIDQVVQQARDNAGLISSGVLGGATLAFEVFTGAILALLASFFYLKDGDRGYAAVLERVEDPDRVGRGLTAAWGTLSAYIRGLALVGAIDAVFIGIGLAIVQTPLIVPLMLLVFLGAFFPIIGAFLSGLVAVLVTLVNGGVVEAAIVLAIVVAIQQLEGHIIYPIVFKRALELHPLVILISIAVGGVAFGIVGAFLAVPLTAVAVTVHQAVRTDPDASLLSLFSSRVYERGPEQDDATDDFGTAVPLDDEGETVVVSRKDEI